MDEGTKNLSNLSRSIWLLSGKARMPPRLSDSKAHVLNGCTILPVTLITKVRTQCLGGTEDRHFTDGGRTARKGGS